MQLERALELLERLRDGFHPVTAEALEAESPCQHPDVIRALFVALRAAEGAAPARRAPARRRADRPNAGKPWSADDDLHLAEAFDAGRGEAELASDFGRSRTAVRLRLEKLGKLAPGEARRRGQATPPPPAALTV